MKNKFLAILLSAVLLLTMIPFAFASSAEEFDGIAQEVGDTVIILGADGFGVNTNVFNRVSKLAPKTGRTIFVLTSTYTLPLTDKAGNSDLVSCFGGGSDWNNAELVLTSKVKLLEGSTVWDFRQVAATSVNDLTAANLPDNAKRTVSDPDEIINGIGTVSLQSGNKTQNIFRFYANTTIDYLNFQQTNTNFLFYLNYRNVTFGEHFTITTNGNTDAGNYPILVEGANDGKNGVMDWPYGTTFSGTQTINVFGGTWNYIAPRSRTGTMTVNGTINLNLKNIVAKAAVSPDVEKVTYSSCFMELDAYGDNARVNVTMEGCTFNRLCFFGFPKSSGSFTSYNGKLSLKFIGANTLDRGISTIRGKNNDSDISHVGLLVWVAPGATLSGASIRASYRINLGGSIANNAPRYSYLLDESGVADSATAFTPGAYAAFPYTAYSSDGADGAKVYMSLASAAIEFDGEIFPYSGYSEQFPVNTLQEAFVALSEHTTERKGTVKMIGPAVGSLGFVSGELPELAGDVIVEADKGNEHLFVFVSGYTLFKNNVTFKNINFGLTSGNKFLYAYDHDIIFENCGQYINTGNGVTLQTNPEKGAADATPKMAIITAPMVADGVNCDNVTLNQTIKITGQEGAVMPIARVGTAYAVNALGQNVDDVSVKRDGTINVIVGENAYVKRLDIHTNENNKYKVYFTVPASTFAESYGYTDGGSGFELRTDRANGSGAKITINGPREKLNQLLTDETWLRLDAGFAKMGENGYSLRAANTDGKFAMRAGFTVPAGNLAGAVEYGVLVKRTANPTALTWFDNNYHYGITELPSAQRYNNGVGKSVVYLNPVLDNADKTTLAEDGRYLFKCPVLFNTLNPTTAEYEYIFNPYVYYQGPAGVRLVDKKTPEAVAVSQITLTAQMYAYAYGADEGVTITASLSDVVNALLEKDANDPIATEVVKAING